jgi:plasmid replication initiation protein
MDSKKLEVKKHVGIIHCSNKLTLLQRKLSNALLYCAYDNLLTREKHIIKISMLSKLIGYDSHDYDSIKRAIKSLMSIVLEWNLLKNGSKSKPVLAAQLVFDDGIGEMKKASNTPSYSWHASTILASASIDGAECTYSYSPELRDLLYMPEIYGKVNLTVQSRFTSTYALALYENCVRYKNLNYTGWILLEIFRKLMGVADNKYQKFKDFKRRVLDKAIQEINDLSDIYVIAELQRGNKQIVAIRFQLSKNEKKSTFIAERSLPIKNTIESDESQELLKLKAVLQNEFGISEKKVGGIFKNYDIKYILEKINIVKNSASYKEKRIKNIAAYFLSALKDDFRLKINSNVSVNYEEEGIRKKADESLEQKNKNAYAVYTREMVFSALKKANKEVVEEIDISFHNQMMSSSFSFLVDKYTKLGNDDPIIKNFYCDYIARNYPDMVKRVSFDEFIREKSA